MALMEDGQTTQEQPAVCNCTEKCVAGTVNTACPVCATNMSGCTGKEPEPETPEETAEPEEPAQKPAGLNPAILLVVLALLGGGGALAYFKLVKNKPKTKGNDNLDDYDYGEDDTDQEDEDSWETEESDEPDDDGDGGEESEDKLNDQYRRLLIQLSYIVQNEGRESNFPSLAFVPQSSLLWLW